MYKLIFFWLWRLNPHPLYMRAATEIRSEDFLTEKQPIFRRATTVYFYQRCLLMLDLQIIATQYLEYFL